MNLSQRVARLEAQIRLLQENELPKPHRKLVIAATMCRDALREFYRGHQDEIDDTGGDDEDYKAVVAPLPLLEEALAEMNDQAKRPERR